jgi:hypothetical protein
VKGKNGLGGGGGVSSREVISDRSADYRSWGVGTRGVGDVMVHTSLAWYGVCVCSVFFVFFRSFCARERERFFWRAAPKKKTMK